MGLLGRWRIFTQKEDGSDSIGTGVSNGWSASANWRVNWACSGRSSSLHRLWDGGVKPVEVRAVARSEVRRSCSRATVSWPVIPLNTGERIFILRPETPGADAARRKRIFC